MVKGKKSVMLLAKAAANRKAGGRAQRRAQEARERQAQRKENK